MTLVARYRARRLSSVLDAYRIRDAEPPTNGSVAARQLADFNTAWQRSLARSAYARAIRDTDNLSAQFASWQEFDARVPVSDKLRLRGSLASATGGAGDVSWRATGGSTGEPFRFPVWPEEAQASALDIWLGRSRYGITPDDPAFLLWGHAHLLGPGLKGALNRVRRQVSDRLLGYTRASAYALAPADLARACDALLSRKPAYAIGYSSALDRFARHNVNRASEIAGLNLKAVIATAEGFPRGDSREVISRTFGAPVVMEYGALETGPIAYQLPSGSFRVFHAHYRLSLRGGEGDAANEILVTSLYPRAMPLLRYALGDLAEVASQDIAANSIYGLARVVGRCNDAITLPTGSTIHSEAITHCVRDITAIDTFQVLAPTGDWPSIRYSGARNLADDELAEIRRRLGMIDPALLRIRVERVNAVPLSVAGKHRMVVKV